MAVFIPGYENDSFNELNRDKDDWVKVSVDDNWPPTDFDDRPKKDKKGKYLNDWE